jgi:pimeloyl-ACP methyl ester carboxylesterase
MILPDGRTLSWAELGDTTSANVVITNHGTASSRIETALYDAAFTELGLRVVAPERPGYGFSDPLPRARTVDEWTADVACLVAEIGVESFAVSGYSGGGAYALSIAASRALGDCVTRVLLRAALAPEQPPRNPLDVEIRARAGRDDWDAFVPWFAATTEDPDLAPADVEALADPAYGAAAIATLEEGGRQGPIGTASDLWAYVHWRFELAAVTPPVDVWHGDADTRVPLSHAVALSEGLPNAVLRVLPGEGHLSIGRYVPEQCAAVARA